MKNMKKMALILAVVMVLGLLCACGKIESKYIGTWEASTCEYMGLTLNVSEVIKGGMTLELKDSGSCTLTTDGDDTTGRWEEVDGGVRIDKDDRLLFLEQADGSLSYEMDGLTLYLVRTN